MRIRHLTNEVVDNRLIEQNRTISRIGNVVDSKTSIEWKCLLDEHVWTNSSNNVIYNKQGCAKCAGSTPLDPTYINQEIRRRNITNKEPIKGVNKSILWECNKCNYNWKTRLGKILYENTGCPNCAGRPKITNEIVDQRLLVLDSNITRIGDYVSIHKKIEWKCGICNQGWIADPSSIFQGTGCPNCRSLFGSFTKIGDIIFRSKREAQAYTIIKQLTETLNVDLELQKRYNVNSRHTADFYIPQYKLWIEIGNFRTQKYLTTIGMKQYWAQQRKELFLHCDDAKSIENKILTIINEQN